METKRTITLIEDIILIELEKTPADISVLSDILDKIALEKIDIDMISLVPPYSNISKLSFTVKDENFSKVLEVSSNIRREDESVTMKVNAGNSKILIRDYSMIDHPGVAAKVFAILSKLDVDLQMVTTAETEISLLIPASSGNDVVKALSDEL